jgi:hypothetical protein
MKTILALTGIWIAALTSCSSPKPPADNATTRSGIINVKVTPWFGDTVAIYASAYPLDPTKRGGAAATHRVDAEGVVGFVVPIGGLYGVRAYADLDGSGRQDAGEPSGSVVNLEPLSPTGSGPEYEPNVLTLPGQGVPVKKPKAEKDPLSRLSPSMEATIRDAAKSVPMLVPGLQVPPLPQPPPP